MELSFPAICESIAERRPKDPALVFRGREFSWHDVANRTSRLASVLLSAGVGRSEGFIGDLSNALTDPPGATVALYLLNGNEYLEGMLGAWKAGAIPFNVNYRYVAAELQYLLDDSRAKAVVIHDRFTPVLADVLDTLEDPPSLILAVADGSERVDMPGLVDYELALASAQSSLPQWLVESWSGDDIYLCYTGGTTGMPKGAMWRQGDFLVSALGIRHKNGVEFSTVEELVDAANSTMRALPAPPLMHGAAHWNAMSAWAAGGTIVIQDVVDRFDPQSILDCIETNRVTSLLLVGDPMARPLLDQLVRERGSGRVRDLGSLRHIISGGAVLSTGSKESLLAELGGIKIIDVLGSTESGRQAIASTSAGSDRSSGFVSASTAVVLDDDLATTLEAGDPNIGWLAQSGRVPIGYLNDPAKTAATFPTISGVRYSVAGDRARVLADGTIELLGRDSVCINTGGEKVFAEEVETALKTHEAVMDAVVCGIASQRFGEEVSAVVELRPGYSPTDTEILEHLGRFLARYKLPKRIVRVPTVVRSPSGKADYRWAKETISQS